VGLPTVTDILRELEKPGRDPRPAFTTATFAEGVEKIADLRPGMILEGVVTNVAAFGAFVDVGVHQDGLVHVSALSTTFVKDPRDVVKSGDVVKVRVVEVDEARKRISLTMRLEDKPDQPRGSRPPRDPADRPARDPQPRGGDRAAQPGGGDRGSQPRGGDRGSQPRGDRGGQPRQGGGGQPRQGGGGQPRQGGGQGGGQGAGQGGGQRGGGRGGQSSSSGGGRGGQSSSSGGNFNGGAMADALRRAGLTKDK
jgi:uncharacterized protein